MDIVKKWANDAYDSFNNHHALVSSIANIFIDKYYSLTSMIVLNAFSTRVISMSTTCPTKKVLLVGPGSLSANVMTFVSGAKIYFQNRRLITEGKQRYSCDKL
jgi:hypothetical protein